MLYLTCTIISSVDLARYGVSRAKDWVSVNCGRSYCIRSGISMGDYRTSWKLTLWPKIKNKNASSLSSAGVYNSEVE